MHNATTTTKARRTEDRRHSLNYVAYEHFAFQNNLFTYDHSPTDQWSQLLSRAQYASFDTECRDAFLSVLDCEEALSTASLQEEASLMRLLCHCLRNGAPQLEDEDWNRLLDKVQRRCERPSTEGFYLWWANRLCDFELSLGCVLSHFHTGGVDAGRCRLVGALYNAAASNSALSEAMERMAPAKFDHQLLLALCAILGTESCDDEHLQWGVRVLLLLVARVPAGSVRFGPQCDHWVGIRALSRLQERRLWLEQALQLPITKAEELLTSVLHAEVV